jgi:hypothetical protein
MAKRKIRCFGGHKPSRLLIAFFLINIPGFVFHVFLCETAFGPTGYQRMLIFGVVMQILGTVTMLITGLMDPGIIPKNYWDDNALKQVYPKFHSTTKNAGNKVMYLHN